MDVGNNGVGICNTTLKLRNDGVCVYDTPMNVGDDYICVYSKLGLEAGNQQ